MSSLCFDCQQVVTSCRWSW